VVKVEVLERLDRWEVRGSDPHRRARGLAVRELAFWGRGKVFPRVPSSRPLPGRRGPARPRDPCALRVSSLNADRSSTANTAGTAAGTGVSASGAAAVTVASSDAATTSSANASASASAGADSRANAAAVGAANADRSSVASAAGSASAVAAARAAASSVASSDASSTSSTVASAAVFAAAARSARSSQSRSIVGLFDARAKQASFDATCSLVFEIGASTVLLRGVIVFENPRPVKHRELHRPGQDRTNFLLVRPLAQYSG